MNLKTIIISTTLLTAACASNSHKKKSVDQNLTSQNRTLVKLYQQRKAPEIADKLAKDAELKKAESYLKSVIKRVIRSNNEVKRSVKKL